MWILTMPSSSTAKWVAAEQQLEWSSAASYACTPQVSLCMLAGVSGVTLHGILMGQSQNQEEGA